MNREPMLRIHTYIEQKHWQSKEAIETEMESWRRAAMKFRKVRIAQEWREHSYTEQKKNNRYWYGVIRKVENLESSKQ